MELLFAKRLRELRKEKGVSQVQLGELLGYGDTAISSYETGRNEPSYTDLIRLKAIMVECFGSVAAAGRATLISQKTLSRRMRGESQFRFDEILRLAYALCMTTQEVHEIFFTRYLEDAA